MIYIFLGLISFCANFEFMFYQYPHLEFLSIYPFLQYPHHVEITLIYNVNYQIKFIIFVFLVLDVVAPPQVVIEGVTADEAPPFLVAIKGVTTNVVAFLQVAIEGVTIDVVPLPLVAIEGVHWARDGPKFVCKVDGCDA